MAQKNFGAMLRDARERRGFDLATAARRLRIRPDILRAIEECDYARMPPRGYTRNMVNAYARLVGLNATEITRMYLDDAYSYQVSRSRSARPAASESQSFDMGAATRRAQRARDRSAAAAARAEDAQYEREPGYTGQYSARGRALYAADAETRRSQPTTQGTSRPRRSRQSEIYAGESSGRRASGGAPTTPYTNFYAGPQGGGMDVRSKLPFIIGGVVILILLIVILSLVLGGQSKPAEETPSVPITGLTDTATNPDGTPVVNAPVAAPIAPESAVFEYQVAEGKTAYVEIYENGSKNASVADELKGGAHETFEVTKTLKFVTTNPDNVTLTVDGETVKPKDTDGSGVYTYTVDFKKILAAWEKENEASINASKAAQSANAANASSTTANGASANGAAASGTTGTDANANAGAAASGTAAGTTADANASTQNTAATGSNANTSN